MVEPTSLTRGKGLLTGLLNVAEWECQVVEREAVVVG